MTIDCDKLCMYNIILRSTTKAATQRDQRDTLKNTTDK